MNLEFRFIAAQEKLRKIINKAAYHKQLREHELTFFKRGMKTCNKWARFYGTIKVHKMKKGEKDTWKTRPVTATPGSPMHPPSKYLDHKLQKLLRYLPTYIQDSRHVMEKLSNIRLPPNAKLFTSDAVSMYTNIKTEHMG